MDPKDTWAPDGLDKAIDNEYVLSGIYANPIY